jgi:opacity protein-like surface antigen
MTMRKFLSILVLAAACTGAMAQNVKDSIWEDTKLGDSKWEWGITIAPTYNYNFNTPAGLSNSGFGLDLSIMEMQWHGWKGGALTLGILDMIFDWQYLHKGFRFTPDEASLISSVNDGRSKGSRADSFFGFPIGISQQFSKDFGISLVAAPGVGIYSYRNDYVLGGIHHNDKLYPVQNRAGFRLNLKAIIWYSDFGVIVRYQPLASKDMNTTTLSIGIAFRN